MAIWWSGKQTVFLEKHSYKVSDARLSQQIRANILKLGQWLQLPVCAKRLHTPELLGLVEFTGDEEIALVYKLPESLGFHGKGCPIDDMTSREPKTMLEVYPLGRSCPQLMLRFKLARKLVQSLSFLHACGWLHKSIRVGALLLFKQFKMEGGLTWESSIENAFLMNYSFSKPDEKRPQQPQSHDGHQVELEQSQNHVRFSQPSSKSNNVDFESVSDIDTDLMTSDSGDHGSGRIPSISTEQDRVTLDIMHHPSKRARPNRRYRHAFDVYSLGIILLEIGLWKPVGDMIDSKEKEKCPFETRRKLVGIAERQLPPRCGSIYARVTAACLNIDAEDSGADLQEQRELCARIAADLALCSV
ncbi:hypothetical protein NKR23_g4296 [Pleurostoma richardsiae]|uniref:Protein kinase domain-containing protein n=1 Tax=Pleurostoma richardsiae TaxID=41990 RepID=A0AA38S4M9_9PEZI|nr:hypothetical protein NKR23_g4296 [Pleurostoma richardsiae]